MNLFENLQLMKESLNNEVLFSFNWEKGSINDNIVKYLKANNIEYRYGLGFKLEAKIEGEWVRFDYNGTIDGETTIYIKPTGKTESSHTMEKYTYIGPVYKFGKFIGNTPKVITTIAKSFDEANRNICFNIKKQLKLEPFNNLTIDKNKIERDTEIENKVKDFEKHIVNNDPKFNFEDPDRPEEYKVESILNFDDWYDENYNSLVSDFADKYEIDETEVIDNEDFKDFIDYEYEDYYRNSNRYLDEDVNSDSKGIKYKIDFDFDYSKYSGDIIEIIEVDDDVLLQYNNPGEEKKLEEWYNDSIDKDEDKIKVLDFKYENVDEYSGRIYLTLKDEPDDEDYTMSCIMDYVFDYPFGGFNNWKSVNATLKIYDGVDEYEDTITLLSADSSSIKYDKIS